MKLFNDSEDGRKLVRERTMVGMREERGKEPV